MQPVVKGHFRSHTSVNTDTIALPSLEDGKARVRSTRKAIRSFCLSLLVLGQALTGFVSRDIVSRRGTPCIWFQLEQVVVTGMKDGEYRGWMGRARIDNTLQGLRSFVSERCSDFKKSIRYHTTYLHCSFFEQAN